MELPNLAGVATQDLVEQIGGSGFKASYINWSRTMQLLRQNAPGWMPYLEPSTGPQNINLSYLHAAYTGVGGFLMIGFKHIDGTVTPPVPQAIMDNRNNAIPYDKITARDITDTHRRGICMAAALTFGLAYELWAKMPLESGYNSAEQEPVAGKPQDGMRMQDFPEDRQREIFEWACSIRDMYGVDPVSAAKTWKECDLPQEEKAAVWFELDSRVRSTIKKTLEAE